VQAVQKKLVQLTTALLNNLLHVNVIQFLANVTLRTKRTTKAYIKYSIDVL